MHTGGHQNQISKAKRPKVGPKWRHGAEKNLKNPKMLNQDPEKSSGDLAENSGPAVAGVSGGGPPPHKVLNKLSTERLS